MNARLMRRIGITLAVLVSPLVFGLLITYQVIHVEWISFMEIQPSYRPMEDAQPVPSRSVPLEGAAFIPGAGNPLNPSRANASSLARGEMGYLHNCAVCHGTNGKGDGPIADELVRKPPDLTTIPVHSLSDGEIFIIITNGLQVGLARQGGMPDLRGNLDVDERWDVVNYLRRLQGAGSSQASSYHAGSCPIHALDLIGAWVEAKTPEKESFTFTDATGKTCSGSFSTDILPLFSQANLWYAGAPSCRTCHGPEVALSYAPLYFADHQGILAGSGRSSQESKGEDILGAGVWPDSSLFEVLNNGEMPPDRPKELNPLGLLLFAGGYP